RKPIIVVKAGRTGAGSRAASSHTAALAARDVAVDALFRQTGVIRADTLEEMFDLASALGNQPLPPGRRVAILTNAGGPAILCADACEAAGLSVVDLSETTKGQLAAFLPATASVRNPVDMIASAGAEAYGRAIKALLASDDVDALIVIHVAAGACDAAAVMLAAQECASSRSMSGAIAKPILACVMPERASTDCGCAGNNNIPCYAFPETAARVLGKAATYAEWKAQPLGRVPELADIDLDAAHAVCKEALNKNGNGWLSTEATRRVLQAMGLPISAGGVAKTAQEAAALARGLGFPVAVKLASHEIVHKTEMGGVHLGLSDEIAVIRAFDEIRKRLDKENQLHAMDGVLIQPMIHGGTEVFVGMTQDPLFGPLIAFGLGGIHVEILGDVCFRVTPLTDRDACEMVHAIRGYRLFQGYRGHPAADVAALEQVLLRVSRLVEEIPEITEVDLNPIFALSPGQGCRIVDARIRVQNQSE
ncbi:MAG TPA: acetate--CoA ligase family protein, partial [Gemmataceae bacterium]|nr:acetate--CoA ligase family protein [Gemmataceae bacterium]